MAEQDEKKETSQPETPSQIRFHYIKSNFFRVVHVDGAHGGVTPKREIEINFYSERPAIPRTMTYRVQPNGHLGDEITEERDTRGGIVREIEVGAVMDIATAEAIITWLQRNIKIIKDSQKKEEQK